MLTKLKIDNFKPEAKPKKYSDSEGLYLQINPSGAKCWRYQYWYMGKQKVLSFGLYPDISLVEAREKRNAAKKLLIEGVDPSTDKKDKVRLKRFNNNNTFAAVAKEWHELNKNKWTPRHQRKIYNRLATYAFSKIGDRPISEISSLEVLDDIIRPIEKKGYTETSHELLQNCSAVFRFAVLTKRAPYNPLADMRGVLKPHKAKSLPAIKIDELPEFMKRLEAYDTQEINRLAIKMLLLTFVRQGELRRAKWEYFDFNKKIWAIPAELMKMREEHLVPLSKQALETLEKIKELSGDSEFLFPTKNKIKNPYMNENAINKVIKSIGYAGKMVGHGFRSLASTTLNELGFKPDIIEKQLAHSERNKVRAAYNRAEYLPQRTAMMQGWSDYIDEVVNGKKDGNIIKFSKKK